jgi:hypothetical protein
LSEEDFNYVLLKMGYTDKEGTPTKIAFTINELNIKTLVGEYKILVDRLSRGLLFTAQEHEEHNVIIKKWEEDLYGT